MAATTQTEPIASQPKQQTRPRRRRRLWTLLAVLLAVILFGPALICLPVLRDTALSAGVKAVPVRGQAKIGALSVGWFAPLSVHDFELSDSQGKALASLPELTIDRSLLDLLLDRRDLGHLRLAHPTITLRLRDDGSNLEDIFADVLARAHRRPNLACDVEIVDATIVLEDMVDNRSWKLEPVNLRLVRTRQGAAEVSCTASMPQSDGGSQLKLQGSLPSASDSPAAKDAPPGSVALEAAGFPLESLRAILARVAPGIAVSGRFDGQLEFTRAAGAPPGEGSLLGDFTVADLLLAGPALGEDVLRLARIEMPCQMSLRGNELAVEKLTLKSDVGQMAGTGGVTLSADASAPRLQSAQGDLAGQIDVAQLARLLPHRIRMRPGTDLAVPIKFHVAPHLKREKGLILELEAGRVLDHVQASPELCDAWLKFAMPVLAEVTQVNGAFSLDLQGLQVPFEKPDASQTAGTILIHNFELGPGPLVREFLPAIETLRGLSGQNETQPIERLSLARDSQVVFRLVDGRVYHEGLRLQFPRLTIETHGSVGFDESLAMIAEISLTGNVLNGPLAQMIKSRPIELPIGGTLRKPKVDLAQLRGLGKQRLRETARELIGNELQRGLDRLLKPKE